MKERKTPAGWRAWLWPPFFTPRGFLHAAAILSLLFAIAHALGWRAYTTIISGTVPDGVASVRLGMAAGATYALLYFAFVLAVPILLIGSGLFAILLRWTGASPPLPKDA
jgi:membrane protease YdiL (CAAX protease family)